MIDVYATGLSIDIGRQGENLARNIYFDLSDLIDNYGEGTATLVHMRPSDQAPYVCTAVRTGTFLIWSPTSTDTAYSGSGKCELRWVVGDTLAKSIIYTTTIAPSLTGAEGVPSPYKSWYDAIIAYIEANYAANGAPQEVREAIYTLLSKAAYTETGLTDELAIVQAWTAETLSVTNNLTHVTNSNTATMAEQGGSYTGTLTADSGYTLGTVSVTMGGEDVTATVYSSGTITIPSVTGDIVITATAVAAVSSLSAVYTQSGTVYDTDALDTLKADLVVTATYSDSTTATVPSSDYTLSGTLAAGTSTVTVSYGGVTTTFNVTVTQLLPTGYTLYNYLLSNGNQYMNSGLSETDIAECGFEYKARVTGYPSGTSWGHGHILSSTNIFVPFPQCLYNSTTQHYYNLTAKRGGSDYTYTASDHNAWAINEDIEVRAYLDGDDVVKLNGDVVLSDAVSGSTLSSSNTCAILGYGGNVSTARYRFIGRLYYLKIYNSNGELIHHYLPVTNASNVAGLYDIVSETFFSSATGTAFSVG